MRALIAFLFVFFFVAQAVAAAPAPAASSKSSSDKADDKTGAPGYPQDLQQRARVNERMDWINSQFARDYNYGFIYPQIFSFAKRRSDEAQAAQIEWGKERSKYWLQVLNDHILAAGNSYLCGDRITIADYFAAPFIGVGEVAGCKFAEYPNVCAWLGRMKALPSWNKVHEAVNGFAASLKGQTFETV